MFWWCYNRVMLTDVPAGLITDFRQFFWRLLMVSCFILLYIYNATCSFFFWFADVMKRSQMCLNYIPIYLSKVALELDWAFLVSKKEIGRIMKNPNSKRPQLQLWASSGLTERTMNDSGGKLPMALEIRLGSSGCPQAPFFEFFIGFEDVYLFLVARFCWWACRV